MNKFITKKTLFFGAFLVALLSWVANYFSLADHETMYVLYVFFFSISLSILITCFSDKIVQSWLKFLVWWMPSALILIFLDSPYNSFIFPGSMRLTRILAVTTVIYSLLFFAINKTSNTTKNSGILVIAHAIAFIGSVVLGITAVNFLKS